MLAGLRNLEEHDMANVAPFIDPGNIPFPRTICFEKDGKRHLLGLRLPTMEQIPDFIDAPKELWSYLFEQDRVNEGLLFEQAIPCYPPLNDDELAMALSVMPCEQFTVCRELWRKGSNDFCTNDEWKRRRDMKRIWGDIKGQMRGQPL